MPSIAIWTWSSARASVTPRTYCACSRTARTATRACGLSRRSAPRGGQEGKEDDMDFRLNEEEVALRRRLRSFGDEQLVPRRAEFEEKEDYPPELFRLVKQENLYRYFLPKEYGGYGISSVNICIIREELCRAY